MKSKQSGAYLVNLETGGKQQPAAHSFKAQKVCDKIRLQSFASDIGATGDLQCSQFRVHSRPRTAGGYAPSRLKQRVRAVSCPFVECQLLGITYKVVAGDTAVVTTRHTVNVLETWILTAVSAYGFGFKFGSHTQSPRTLQVTCTAQVRAPGNLFDTSVKVSCSSTSALCSRPLPDCVCSESDRKTPDQVMRPGPLAKVSTSLILWILMLICDVLRHSVKTLQVHVLE